MLRSVLSAARPASRPQAAPVPMVELWRQAEACAAALPPYAVAADRRLRAAARGVHARRRAGPGDAFWQFRPYEPGEPAARIDWRRSGRTDSLYVRQREWETAQSVWFWVDGSPSMHFRSSGAAASKSDRAVLLALAAAKLLAGTGERVGLYGMDERAAAGQYGLNRFRVGIERMREQASAAIPPVHPVPRRARLLLIGDFLQEDGPAQEAIAALGALGADGHLLQILDPVEEAFPYRGRVSFESVENEERLLLNRSDEMGEAYRSHLAAWIETLRAQCRRLGWTHSLHRTDHPASAALIALMSLTGRTT